MDIDAEKAKSLADKIALFLGLVNTTIATIALIDVVVRLTKAANPGITNSQACQKIIETLTNIKEGEERNERNNAETVR